MKIFGLPSFLASMLFCAKIFLANKKRTNQHPMKKTPPCAPLFHRTMIPKRAYSSNVKQITGGPSPDRHIKKRIYAMADGLTADG
jgi:hypothetical protein